MKLLLFLLALSFALPGATAVIGPAEGWIISARGTPTITSPLQAGTTYDIVISGVYAYGTDGKSFADCNYYTYPSATNWNYGSRMLWWNDGTGARQFPCGAYSSGHTYVTQIVGKGASAVFWISDSNYGDNNGYLTYTLTDA